MKKSTPSNNLVRAINGITILRSTWKILLALSNVIRRCLVPIISAVLMIKLMNLPQSQEFFDGLLKVCATGEKRCSTGLGVRATALQFVAFEIITFLFALVIWYSARVLASYRRPGPYDPDCFEKWIPRLTGAIPLYVLASTMLGPIRSFASPLQVVLGLSFVALLMLTPAVVHIHRPHEFSVRKMVVAIAISTLGIIFCTIHPATENDHWWTAGSWVIMFLFYVIFA